MPISTIILKGIALSYLKTENGHDVWRVLFPFDPEGEADSCHLVKLKFESGETLFLGKNKMANGAKRLATVEIRLRDVSPVNATSENTYLQFLNVTERGVLHDQVEMVPANLNEIDMVKLTIPNAKMSVNTFFQHPLRIVRVFPEPAEVSPYRAVGHTARVEIVCNGFDVVVTGAQSFTRYVAPGESVTFDNDCAEIDEERDDFDMIYQIIKDKTVQGRRFGVRLRSQQLKSEMSNPSLDDRSLDEIPFAAPKGMPCEMLAVDGTYLP